MRILRLLFASLAVIAGLVGALLLVTFGFMIFALLRLFGRPATMPRFQRPTRPSPARPVSASRDEVIDVEVTQSKN